jgi:hypothetical protein
MSLLAAWGRPTRPRRLHASKLSMPASLAQRGLADFTRPSLRCQLHLAPGHPVRGRDASARCVDENGAHLGGLDDHDAVSGEDILTFRTKVNGGAQDYIFRTSFCRRVRRAERAAGAGH